MTIGIYHWTHRLFESIECLTMIYDGVHYIVDLQVGELSGPGQVFETPTRTNYVNNTIICYGDALPITIWKFNGCIAEDGGYR